MGDVAAFGRAGLVAGESPGHECDGGPCDECSAHFREAFVVAAVPARPQRLCGMPHRLTAT